MSDPSVVGLLEKELESVEKQIEAKVGPLQRKIEEECGELIAKEDALKAAIKKLSRGSGGTAGPQVPDEDIVAAVKHVSKNGPATSPDIAKHLEVDVRKISRKLAKLSTDGTISGNKDDGYSA